MTFGHLSISKTPRETLDLGIVQKLEDQINVNVIHVPIVTYSAENAFAFDSGTQDQFTVNLVRRNPDDAYDPLDDPNVLAEIIPTEEEDEEDAADRLVLEGSWQYSSIWCNRLWKKALVMLVNRWQARTDGNRLCFIPIVIKDESAATPEGVYQHELNDVNVYFKNLTINYDTNSFEVLRVSMTLIMGTMSGNRSSGGF